MSYTAIQVENLGKLYRIGARERYKTLRDTLSNTCTALLHFLRSTLKHSGGGSPEEKNGYIWALKDISLKIPKGGVVGIIGRNGAGKSTLLKILSRITEPTEGFAKIKGRVGSLLEVGTGFHPELTGRENIYLNGAILGMRKVEIARKFDEIVAFADVEKFLDTPVKRYSSGMHMRLAFAVAAHLEPEIMIVDEVLAVGDVGFQKKCLGKMGDVANTGRTVLFVSHNLQAIRLLCPRCILLDKGVLITDGATQATLDIYGQKMREMEIGENSEIHNPAYRRGSGAIRFTSVSVQDECGHEKYNFAMGDTIRFKFSYKVFKDLKGLAIYVGLRSGLTGEIVTTARHVITADQVASGATGTIFVELPDIYIRPGEYPLYLHISDLSDDLPNFDVVDGITAPLVIWPRNESPTPGANFDPSRPVGYFSIPSRVFLGNQDHAE